MANKTDNYREFPGTQSPATSPPDDVNAQFAQLQQDYLAKLPTKYQGIRQDWLAFQSDENCDNLQKVYRGLHAMAGTSSVLGIDAVSALARQNEAIVTGKETLTNDERSALQAGLEQLDQLIVSGNLSARKIDLGKV